MKDDYRRGARKRLDRLRQSLALARHLLNGSERFRPVVAGTETRPALERAIERARLGEPEGERDVGDGAVRILDVAQGQILARGVDEFDVRRVRLGELALQRAGAHVKLLRCI